MNKYDRVGFIPPAPVCKMRIIAPAHTLLGIDEASLEITALLDTGADCGCLPQNVIAELESLRKAPLAYTRDNVQGVGGGIDSCRFYELIVEIAAMNLKRAVVFAAVPDTDALIGRDVLNDHSVLYNGPDEWWNKASN